MGSSRLKTGSCKNGWYRSSTASRPIIEFSRKYENERVKTRWDGTRSILSIFNPTKCTFTILYDPSQLGDYLSNLLPLVRVDRIIFQTKSLDLSLTLLFYALSTYLLSLSSIKHPIICRSLHQFCSSSRHNTFQHQDSFAL
jgi:hypothetical protein